MTVLLERDVQGCAGACAAGLPTSLAERGAGSEGFVAQVYSPEGRRVTARVRSGGAQGDCGGMPVFCEAALGDCAAVYGPAPGRAQVDAVLRLSACSWRAVESAESGALMLRPLHEDERGLVRGIYALAAPARQCPVRATRAIWDALMERWLALGWRIYVVERCARAVGYMLLGAPQAADGMSEFAALYEYAALPDDGPRLYEALAAGCATGVCAARGRVLGSVLECAPCR